MPPKVRDLARDLERAGFVERGGKGSHRKFVHPRVRKLVVLSGKPGDDALAYQRNAVKTAIEDSTPMKESARYVKIVEWSDADKRYVGSCPGLFYGGCHGQDEREVFTELCRIVEATIVLYKKDGKPLPPVTCGKDYANRMLNVA